MSRDIFIYNIYMLYIYMFLYIYICYIYNYNIVFSEIPNTSYHIIIPYHSKVGEGDRGEKREREKRGRQKESCGMTTAWAQG